MQEYKIILTWEAIYDVTDIADSVSYTHLDVYKRQMWYCSKYFSNLLCQLRSLLRFQCKSDFILHNMYPPFFFGSTYILSLIHIQMCIRDRLSSVRLRYSQANLNLCLLVFPTLEGKGMVSCPLAVSYTHLDVYKRQACSDLGIFSDLKRANDLCSGTYHYIIS